MLHFQKRSLLLLLRQRTTLRFYSPYEVLQIPEHSSFQTVKAAYVKLAKQYHPDLKQGNEERFKQINAAYEQLCHRKAQKQRPNSANYGPYENSDYPSSNPYADRFQSNFQKKFSELAPSQILKFFISILVLSELADQIHHKFCVKQRKSAKVMFETNQHHDRYKDQRLFRMEADTAFVFVVPYYWVITLILILKWLLVNLLQTCLFNIKKQVITRKIDQKQFNALISIIQTKTIDPQLWLLFCQKYEVYIRQQPYYSSADLYFMKKDIQKKVFTSKRKSKPKELTLAQIDQNWNKLISQSVQAIQKKYGSIGRYLLQKHRESFEQLNN